MHRMFSILAFVLAVSFVCGTPLSAQSSPEPAAGKPAVAATEKTVRLPLRRIALYKNGVGFFELAGKVTGDAVVQIDCTTAQLNDVLQSLTAVDGGGGHIVGLGFDSSETLKQQLAQLHLGLGPDPTVVDLLQSIKGTRVEVRGGGAAVTGKLLNVEVRPYTNPRTGEQIDRRVVSVVTDAGSVRSMELTPTVEVRMLGSAQRQEIGRYLQILAASHEDGLRHLTIEDRGTGERALRISYIAGLPAWKSSYRVLTTSGSDKTATLQGWAVIDNTTAEDWKDVQLTLVSGAPQSFVQQLSRPNNVARPELGMEGGVLPPQPMAFDPLGGGGRSSRPTTAVAIDALAMGGGAGTQISAFKPQPAAADGADYQLQARDSVSPSATSADLDDMFEYKLAKPMTIRRNESAVVPILQTQLDAERVSLWASRDRNRGVQRALWLRNSSGLTLDQGSFTIVEDGTFGGQGQIPLLHPDERKLAAYGVDQAIKIDGQETKQQPPKVNRIQVNDGVLSVHDEFFRTHLYTIQNAGSTARTVVLELPQSEFTVRLGKNMGPWNLSKETPAVETIQVGSTKLYRFTVEVEAHSTKELPMTEWHTHPVKTPLEKMSVADLALVIRGTHDDADVVAKLQPILDAKKKLVDLDAQMKDQQRAIGEVNAEEARLRQNIAALKGSAEEKPLSKRYVEAMAAQEDKLTALNSQREAARQARDSTQKTLTEQIRSLQTDLPIPKA